MSPLTVQTIKDQQKFNLFDWISQNLDNSVFCTSNMSQNKDEERLKGLVEGHAYSLLHTAKLKLKTGGFVELVKIRNPWAQMEFGFIIIELN